MRLEVMKVSFVSIYFRVSVLTLYCVKMVSFRMQVLTKVMAISSARVIFIINQAQTYTRAMAYLLGTIVQ